jgi:methionyl-tRNA formyltransferase
VAVVTQPDRPAGRGRGLRPPPVKVVAAEEMIPVLQPERARGSDFVAQLHGLAPEVSIVVAYGQILPREVLELPPHGSLNLHASLLPQLRGAAPINYAIMLGHEHTGVSVMRMVEALDAGPVLHQVTEPIADEETASDLTARLSEIGAEALVETLAMLELGDVQELPQDDAAATYAPRLTRATTRVDWAKPAGVVARQLRALDASPGAWTTWRDVELKLYCPLPADDETARAEPGTVLRTTPVDLGRGLLVQCGGGALWIREVKPAGKRRMTAAEWLRGRSPEPGDRLV